MTPLKRVLLAVIAILIAGRLFLGPFREGWSHMRTDFPVHWVAARLALRREPLRQFYDWEWFQRQIQVSGIERQLGGFIPNTPLVMLPYLPVANFPPQQAKQIWLIAQIGFLGLSIWLLARLTKLGILETLRPGGMGRLLAATVIPAQAPTKRRAALRRHAARPAGMRHMG